MAGEWRVIPFSQAVTVNPRVQLKRGAVFPFVDMGAISSGSRSAFSSEERKFDGGGSRFAVGDTLMARITPCLENGKISRFAGKSGETAHGSTEFIVIRGREGVSETDYAYYLTKWDGVSGYAISQMTGTSGRQRVPTQSLDHLEVPIPPLPEQRAIAHILGTLDDKIELNRRMNETLEAMARTLFKSWFVDFDPVRAKAAGCDPGLPKELAALFPNSFQDSELGEIPEGWEVVQFADLLVESNQRIGSTEAPEYSSTNDGLQLRSERFNKTLGMSSAKNKLIRRGFLVFGLSRRVLNFGLMREELGSVSSAYKVFTVREGILSSDLLERLMRMKLAYFYTAVSASSREGQSVSAESLSLLKVVVPPRVVQDAFCASDSHFAERIAATAAESRTLVALRDVLLPKLISGELRLRDAEKIAGRAA